VRALLMKLSPWRKGPFHVHGITIDAEWRSDLKWDRLIDHIEPLAGRRILDVGAGNGWYSLQMLKEGANVVIGIDPTVLFIVQFEAIRKLCGVHSVHVLPLRLEDLPPKTEAFDTTFSMGVLYHRRDPQQHLGELLETLKPGGELVLETLVLPGDGRRIHEPVDRYARMRNVWHLPTIPVLRDWVQEAGFAPPRVIDVSTTTSVEQRSTEWMPFESLAEALDSENPDLTVEGLPAPTRAILSCRKP
ncbi:MAG: tRNA 5-methoxyuridine(34)/uridine 5-oxyacetic acid(34) synthase CmoB, partial [Gammaproteobacteria bacterium]|nr:tRNA 5-methoxyuridine(34)/uridine 5-oxyacetic acid(34) synthase CmoB [Gammaproteobacteria bacterium]